MADAICVAVDWGTSNLRAALLGAHGEVLETCSRARGILAVEDGAFSAELDAVCRDWRKAKQNIPVLMSGMIGSQQGWVEAPYLNAPCDLSDLIKNKITVPDTGKSVQIIPGIKARTKHGAPEIMRGEETQVGGVIERHGVRDGLFCIPGTHSKWVHVRDGRIEDFATFMTGEVFAILKEHSILGRLMGSSDTFDEAAFKQGLARSNQPGSLLHRLFSARTLGILDEIPTSSLTSLLSGQLIGAELRGVTELYGKLDHVNLLSSGTISRSYSQALEAANVNTTIWNAEEAAWAGLWVAAESLVEQQRIYE